MAIVGLLRAKIQRSSAWALLGLVVGAWAAPDFSMAGFATQNGGTTGGKGGQTVVVKNLADLKKYAESSTPYIIQVEGTIDATPVGAKVSVKSNKTLVGVGSSAFLKGIGLSVSNSNNVILQNLKITLVGTTTPSSFNGGDCIVIEGTSKNVWVDHNEVYSEDPSVQTDKDKYDGMIDIRGQTGFITVSWNYFHDHHKCGLVGSADDDLYADRKVTYHHNHYDKVLLRIPMYRGSTGHFFNNYVSGAKDATEIRANTCVRVEKNYYEALEYSIYTPSESPGKTQRIDNIEVKRTSRAYPVDCVADIPYAYANVLTTTTSEIRTLVPQYAGVGKISQNSALALADPKPVQARVEWIDLSGRVVSSELRSVSVNDFATAPAGLHGLFVARAVLPDGRVVQQRVMALPR